jgi:predicted nucleic acid-binding Zn finger protein
MSTYWQRLAEVKVLDSTTRQAIIREYGQRGENALAAIDHQDVKKYLDFFVVRGKTGEYVVEEDFCTCPDFIYRNRECWHLLAVRIAQATGTFVKVDCWYQDQWQEK